MPTASSYRKKLGALMAKSVADQEAGGNWAYVFARPQKVAYDNYTALVRIDADCGDYCRVLCHLAVVPDDPAGTGYAEYGNTSYIWAHLHHAPLETVEVGDIFTFGYHSGERHACMAYNVDDKHDPLCANMGTQGQPVFRRLSQEIAGHRGMTVTLCKLNLPPDPPPTPEEILREKKGYYSWVAWRLGEGVTTWKPYGPKNKAVRPDIPAVIPPKWWRDYAAYLARRKKGNRPTSK